MTDLHPGYRHPVDVRGIRLSLQGLQWFSRSALPPLLIGFAILGVPGLYFAGAIDIESVNQLGRFLCFAIVALSLDLIWGYGGMLCMCQLLFFSLGGYAMGMYLAHHGGPEGIIDAEGWGKIPACLYVVYPYQVGESASDAVVPWFWKPFWTLPITIALGLAIPGIVAGLVGYFVFRSRVRGVFFAVLTQAIVLAFWLVFSMNSMKLCGTNGLTRFDRIVLSANERVEIVADPAKLAESGLSMKDVGGTLEAWCASKDGAKLSRYDSGWVISLDRTLHVWNERKAIAEMRVAGDSTLASIASVTIRGYKLTDPNVKLALYVISVAALVGSYFLCRALIKCRLGRVLLAIRDNESRVRFNGYEPYMFKMLFFSLSAMIAGLAGMLYAPQMRIITPTNLEPRASILVVVWVAVGGRGSLGGAILGALTMSYCYDYLTSNAPDSWPLVLGALVVTITRLPGGLMSIWNRWLNWPLRGRPNSPDVEITKLAGSQTFLPADIRWGNAVCIFGWVSALFAAFLALAAFRFGGPYGSGLMKAGSGGQVITGLLMMGVAVCAAVQIPASLGLAWQRVWGRNLAQGIFTAILALLGGTILWLFLANNLSEGSANWFRAGLSSCGEFVRSFPCALLAAIWSVSGLVMIARTRQCWWHAPAQMSSAYDSPPWLEPTADASKPRATKSQQLTSEPSPAAESDRQLLRVKSLRVLFDGFLALDIDEFSVNRNELNVIIGPNGAGKTTLCDAISGMIRSRGGTIEFSGVEIGDLSEVQIARLGVGRKFQTPTVYDSLTVYENLELALPGRANPLANFRFRPTAAEHLQIMEVLKRVSLTSDRQKPGAFLGHGQRQWLEIAMLILARPKLLLIDEPAAGLTDEQIRLTAALLLELKQHHSIIVIEHDMEFVRMLDSPVTVLIDGVIEARGTMQEIQQNEKVREAYLGR